jgi:predicted MPP superfamily phosphohydrolase
MIPLSTILFRIFLVFSIITLLDFYVFSGIKAATSNGIAGWWRNIILYGYWTVSIGLILYVVYAVLTFSRTEGPSRSLYILFGIVILFTVPKLVFAVILLLEDIFRGGRAIVIGSAKAAGADFAKDLSVSEGRRQVISLIGLGAATVPFLGILHGIIKGKYQYTVHNTEIKFKDLPDAFDGFRIVQISDVHSGSFDSPADVKRGIELINAQKGDLFVFTGDLVNNLSTEMEPWIGLFKQIKAPFGQYSIFGNHDYSDYIAWPTPQSKKANLDRLKDIHKEIGFRLLLNENVDIEKDGQKIKLLGMENWGKGFSQYGDFEKTLQGVQNSDFKILLSHDPSHWDEQVLPHQQHVHLALAGHTHGMQFGIEIPGIKWSPVKFRYPRWAGLYEESGKYLYVNRGFGFLGFPGRVGIWPEITVITLRKA